ncbi:hypothetical protein [Nocardiopsis kunsanensis]|nr:hypothetical protein [Nocardiopsis kunsanensis]
MSTAPSPAHGAAAMAAEEFHSFMSCPYVGIAVATSATLAGSR